MLAPTGSPAGWVGHKQTASAMGGTDGGVRSEQLRECFKTFGPEGKERESGRKVFS